MKFFKNYSEPPLGQERLKKKFAWLPTRATYCWVWLECYYSHERYMSVVVDEYDSIAGPREGRAWVEFKREEMYGK